MLRNCRTLGGERQSIIVHCRVMRIGCHISVSAMGMDGNGTIVGLNDPYIQTAQCLLNIAAALAEEGASMTNIVSTRVYVTNADHWRKIEEAYADIFRTFCAGTKIEVRRLLLPDILVKIEIDAVVA